METAKKNVAVLATCQALLFTNNATVIALNGLAGYALAADKALATLPVTGWVIGGALSTFPASLLMKRLGRRRIVLARPHPREFLAFVLRRDGVRRLQRGRPVLPLRGGRRGESRLQG